MNKDKMNVDVTDAYECEDRLYRFCITKDGVDVESNGYYSQGSAQSDLKCVLRSRAGLAQFLKDFGPK